MIDPALLGHRLDEWIRGKLFARTRREEWFEAVLFYSARNPKLRYAYAYWEQCGREWTAKRPRSYPAFDAWLKAALNCSVFPVSANRLATAVQSYLAWLSLAYWLEPILENNLHLPRRLLTEMRTTGGRFREIANELESESRSCLPTTFHLIRWIEDRYFAPARTEAWIDPLRHYAHNDPQYVRTSEYARRWREEQPQKNLRLYPSFAKWCEGARNFVNRSGAEALLR